MRDTHDSWEETLMRSLTMMKNYVKTHDLRDKCRALGSPLMNANSRIWASLVTNRFTLCNRWEEDESINKRLYQFIANKEWQSQF